MNTLAPGSGLCGCAVVGWVFASLCLSVCVRHYGRRAGVRANGTVDGGATASAKARVNADADSVEQMLAPKRRARDRVVCEWQRSVDNVIYFDHKRRDCTRVSRVCD